MAGEFRKKHPEAFTLIYSSLPCVGGSPWGNVNSVTEKGSKTIAEQQKLFATLLKSLRNIIAENADETTFVAFELSKNCKYWKCKWPIVHKFIRRLQLPLFPFHGCQFGVVGATGKPMLKSCQIASNIEMLNKLKNMVCSGEHEHGQSRGSSLKLAENYTFALTAFIHQAFKSQLSGHEPPLHQSKEKR